MAFLTDNEGLNVKSAGGPDDLRTTMVMDLQVIADTTVAGARARHGRSTDRKSEGAPAGAPSETSSIW
jgi:hypothetical protein